MSQIEMDFCMVFFWLGTAVFGALALARMAAGKIHLFGPSPFSSRAEYLEAAAEMDLEEFIGRARVTPESVKQKPEAKPPTLFQVMADVERTLRENPVSLVDVTTTVDSSCFSVGEVTATVTPLPACVDTPGFQGINAPAAVGVDGGGPGWVSTAQFHGEKLAKKFPLDRWFRDPQDRLVQVSAILDDVIECKVALDTWFFYKPEDLRPAVPKNDEWWRWTKKELLDGFWSMHQEPFQFVTEVIPRFEFEVQAGNLEPVNFGKGPEKKSGVA